MLVFLLIIATLILFYQELLWLGIQVFLAPKVIDHRPWSVQAAASSRRLPQLHLIDFAGIESMSFRTFFKDQIFVSRGFWENLREGEREALYLWHTGSLRQSDTFSRIIGQLAPTTSDRDAVLLGAKPLDLIAVIEKARDFYLSPLLTFSQNCFGGLSITGDSLFRVYDEPEIRLRRLSERWLALKEDE